MSVARGKTKFAGVELKYVTVRMPLKTAGALYRAAARRSRPKRKVFVSDVVREAVDRFLREERR